MAWGVGLVVDRLTHRELHRSQHDLDEEGVLSVRVLLTLRLNELVEGLGSAAVLLYDTCRGGRGHAEGTGYSRTTCNLTPGRDGPATTHSLAWTRRTPETRCVMWCSCKQGRGHGGGVQKNKDNVTGLTKTSNVQR
jgi:hypothetical protein